MDLDVAKASLTSQRSRFGGPSPQSFLTLESMSPLAGRELSFAIDFEKFAVQFDLLPSEVDEAWREFDPDLCWSDLVGQALGIKGPDYFASLFHDELPLFQSLRHLFEYFPLVIDPEAFSHFASLPILDPPELIGFMPRKRGILLHSAVYLVSVILQNLESYDVRQKFVFEFAKKLTPQSILQPKVPREYIRYVLFVPVSNQDKQLFWFVADRDGKVVVIPFDGHSGRVSAAADEVELKGEQLLVGANVYRFLSANGRACFVKAQQETDPLVSFLTSLREVGAYKQSLPREFTEQLTEAIGASDLVLATAVCQSVPISNRAKIWPVLAALTNSEAITLFFRRWFAIDIAKVPDASRFFRDNSVGMAAASLVLRAHGQDVADAVLDIATRNPGASARDLLLKWMPVAYETAQVNRILFRFAFLAARRRFPKGIIPVAAIGSLLGIRHILAELAERLPASGVVEQMMNIALFRPEMKEMSHDDEIFRVVAKFLIELAQIKANHVPKDSFLHDELIAAMLEIRERIISEVANPKKGPLYSDVHPAVFAVHEMIETYFTGPAEDPAVRIDQYFGLA
jgi:hypothetical protein